MVIIINCLSMYKIFYRLIGSSNILSYNLSSNLNHAYLKEQLPLGKKIVAYMSSGMSWVWNTKVSSHDTLPEHQAPELYLSCLAAYLLRSHCVV